MKKFTTTIAMMMAMALSLFAQIPQTMSYQAVVRNTENAIVVSQSVSIELSILQGSDEGSAVYTETHNATTNANGLITLEMGAGESSDDFSAIDWSAGPYFVKTVAEIDGKQVSGVSPMLVVPYAKYAETAGNVPDMSEYAKKSDIPAEADLSNYATKSDLPDMSEYAAKSELTGYAKTSDLSGLATKSELDGYAKTSDLPTVPTTVAELTDAADYATKAEIADMATKTYVDDKVAAVEVPTTVAELTDAADYANVQSNWAETDDTKDSYIQNKPDLSVYAAKSELEDYAKASDLSGLATKAEIADMATKTYVDDKVAAVEVPTTVAELTDAADYAKTEDLSDYYKKSDVDALLAELTGKIQQLDELLNLPEGAIYGKFSVSANDQVYFSQGNLQYQASTSTWQFAENQYDIIGADNKNISSTYSGWIDLFGWGTSGWNSGANAYQPYSTNKTNEDYYPGGSESNNLTGDYANADWGVYNKISNGGNTAGQWRTLTNDEWDYVLNTRTDASALKGSATVNGVTGMVLLPDNWTTPSDITFTSGMNGFSNNTYTTSDWVKMEANGAVFLPAAGYRYGTDVLNVGSYGYYWSASSGGSNNASCLGFSSVDASMGSLVRYLGQSVRLVCGL